MSLITKQIKRLREYADNRKGEIADICREAADTIEMLSEKVRAANMERSSAYYNGGWIPVSERLPEEPGTYLVTIDYKKHGTGITTLWFHNKEIGWDLSVIDAVIAWQPLPKPFQEEN